MAKPKTLRGSKFLIQIEDSDSPATYVAPCALTAKSIDFAAESNEFNVPDCSDPDAPTHTERVVSALSAGISGSGVLAMDALDTWRSWFDSGEEKNIRVKLDATLADGGGHWQMSAILTGLSVSGNTGELAQIEVTIASNGAWTWVPAQA